MSCKATINSPPHSALAISGDAADWIVFGLIGHLSYDLMVLWGKQPDDVCDGALMSQKRVNADAVVWLQVLSAHTLQVFTVILSSNTENNEILLLGLSSMFSLPFSLQSIDAYIHESD